jgi:hypothetical protein
MKQLSKAARRIITDIKDYKIAILCIIIYTVFVKTIFHAFCPMLIMTGIPCPGCGMTRALYCLITFQLKRSISLNPAALLWLIFIAYIVWNRYILGTYNKRVTSILLAFVCIITLIIYIYRMVNCFPSYPPMVYYKDNLILRFIKQAVVK